MKLAAVKIPCLSATVVVLAALHSLANDSNTPILSVAEPNQRTAIAAVIPVSGMIDDGLYESIKRRTQTALDDGATYIIYEIGTYGGLVKSADDISKYFIHDVNPKADTVAYVTTEAISAGAMISVSCRDIIMRTSTTIGDCAPIELGGTLEGVEREKTESFIRAVFERAAEANHYPAALLRAMVTQRIEVWRVKDIATGKYEFFEAEQLPKDANEYDLANKELVDNKDEILTLTASRALEYGVARAVVPDRAAALAFLEKRDNVVFTGKPVILDTNWSEELVRLLNNPAVTAILFMIGLLGIYMELSTPGIGLPGLVAVICFAILFGSKYLVGLANWLDVALFVVGVLLLLIEILVIPGFGITGLVGIVLMIAGLLGMFIPNNPGQIPWPKTSFDWTLLENGALTLGAGFIGFLVLARLLARYLPKISFLSGLMMMPAAAGGIESPISMTAPPETTVTLEVGQIGMVITPLRPSGKAQFESVFVDVVAQGEFLKKGTRVKIVQIVGNRVVVEAAK
jgi:membrane-bound serine protease (ClpP class)